MGLHQSNFYLTNNVVFICLLIKRAPTNEPLDILQFQRLRELN